MVDDMIYLVLIMTCLLCKMIPVKGIVIVIAQSTSSSSIHNSTHVKYLRRTRL